MQDIRNYVTRYLEGTHKRNKQQELLQDTSEYLPQLPNGIVSNILDRLFHVIEGNVKGRE